jgi:threonine/homoserine/homoserine lactone efflux protein
VALSMLMAFWMVSFSLVMVPGADWAYAISAGMRDRAIAPAIAGLLSGYLMITLVVAAGIGALLARVPVAMTVLTFAGAAYLFRLGVNVFLRPSIPAAGAVDVVNSKLEWAARGFAISGANPKALLLFLALLPQFTRQGEAWPVSAQIGALGLVQIVNCAIVYSLVAVGSKVVLRARPEVARRVSQLSGAAMVLIAVLLLIEQIGTLIRQAAT